MSMGNVKTKVAALILIVILSCTALQGLALFTMEEEQSRPPIFYEFLDRTIDRIHEDTERNGSASWWAEAIVRGLLRMIDDPYSRFLDSSEYQDFLDDMIGTFGGVGVVITQEGDYSTVVRTLPDGPAEEAGVQPGDRIYSIDNEEVVGVGLQYVSHLLKGKVGTELDIVLLRNDVKEQVNITRDTIRVNTVESSLLEDHHGYVRISLFNEHTTRNLSQALYELQEKNIKGVILDLRDNPGGLLNQGIEVAKLLVPAGPVVHVEKRSGKTETYEAKGEGLPWPLVVLVNGGSASASEIVAGAVRDRQAGLIVGTQTYGKGSVQSVFGLGEGGLRITMANYLTPNREHIEGVGIRPDVLVYPKITDPQGARIETVPVVKTLRPGDQGKEVENLQRILLYLGFLSGEVAGVYDQDTEEAIREFQQLMGLSADGTADRETLSELNYALLAQVIPSAGDAQLEKALEMLKQKIQ